MRSRTLRDAPTPATASASDRSDGRSARSLVARHPMAAFFALSYVIAWGWLPFGSFGAFSPLISAAVVIAMTQGRSGFARLGSRLLRWRIGWRWYAAAVAFPLGTFVLSASMNRAMGAPAPSLHQFTPWYAVLLLFAMNLVNPLGGPLGEEPGWRGFAQPGLQGTRSPLTATGILAVLVTGWHIPLMMPAFGLRPIELLSTVAVTFWYSWLFNRSGGSVIPTLIAHSVDASLENSTLWSGADSTRVITLWALIASTLAVALVAADWGFWTGRSPSARHGQVESGGNPPPLEES